MILRKRSFSMPPPDCFLGIGDGCSTTGADTQTPTNSASIPPPISSSPASSSLSSSPSLSSSIPLNTTATSSPLSTPPVDTTTVVVGSPNPSATLLPPSNQHKPFFKNASTIAGLLTALGLILLVLAAFFIRSGVKRKKAQRRDEESEKAARQARMDTFGDPWARLDGDSYSQTHSGGGYLDRGPSVRSTSSLIANAIYEYPSLPTPSPTCTENTFLHQMPSPPPTAADHSFLNRDPSVKSMKTTTRHRESYASHYASDQPAENATVKRKESYAAHYAKDYVPPPLPLTGDPFAGRCDNEDGDLGMPRLVLSLSPEEDTSLRDEIDYATGGRILRVTNE